MENKLQELTQKLYTIGVEKAKNEAERNYYFGGEKESRTVNQKC
ncbi:MAG: hypothetical protein FD181_2742 [Prolixibacteraceae bacterium]|nr:MAG: hypothetical protein FD181_2742 [Prolixibacteraceae bacterium]